MIKFLKRTVALSLCFVIIFNLTACFFKKDDVKTIGNKKTKAKNEEQYKDKNGADTRFISEGEDQLTLFNVESDFTIEIKSDSAKIQVLQDEDKVNPKVEVKEDIVIVSGPNGKWQQGKEYKLYLQDGQTFNNPDWQKYSELTFFVKREATNTAATKKNVKIYSDTADKSNVKGGKVKNKNVSSTKDIDKEDIKENNIIITENNGEFEAVKITKVNSDGTFETETPSVEEIYEDIDYYDTFSLDDLELETGSIGNMSEYEEKIAQNFKNSQYFDAFLDAFIQTVYAAEVDEQGGLEVEASGQGKSGIGGKILDTIKKTLTSMIGINVELNPNKEKDYGPLREGFTKLAITLDIGTAGQKLANGKDAKKWFKKHKLKFTIVVDLKSEVVCDIKGINDIDLMGSIENSTLFKMSIAIVNEKVKSKKGVDKQNHSKALQGVLTDDQIAIVQKKLGGAIGEKFSNIVKSGQEDPEQFAENIELFCIPIPLPIPGIVLQIPIGIDLGLNGGVELSSETKITHKIKVGFSFHNGKFEPVGDLSSTLDKFKLDITCKLEFSVYLAIGLRLTFINNKIAYVGIKPSGGLLFEVVGRATFELTGQQGSFIPKVDGNLALNMKLYLVGNIFFEYKLPGLDSKSKNILGGGKGLRLELIAFLDLSKLLAGEEGAIGVTTDPEKIAEKEKTFYDPLKGTNLDPSTYDTQIKEEQDRPNLLDKLFKAKDVILDEDDFIKRNGKLYYKHKRLMDGEFFVKDENNPSWDGVYYFEDGYMLDGYTGKDSEDLIRVKGGHWKQDGQKWYYEAD